MSREKRGIIEMSLKERISVHQKSSIVVPKSHSQSPGLQGGCQPRFDLSVEEYMVAPEKHPIVSNGVKDFLYIFSRLYVCPRGQDQGVNSVVPCDLMCATISG